MLPIHCPCGFSIGKDNTPQEVWVPQSTELPKRQHAERPVVQISEKGQANAAICRSNVCGYYDAEHDACGILRDRGKAGAVTYLLTHPETKCVAPEPLF
jgi:hypothetical protein